MAPNRRKNISTFLESVKLILTSTDEELKNKIVKFRCETTGQITELDYFSYNNKKNIKNIMAKKQKNKEDISNIDIKSYKIQHIDICSSCEKTKKDQERFEEYKNNILKTSGHLLLKIMEDSQCIYKCKTCSKEQKSNLNNVLNKNQGGCEGCNNEKFKNNLENIAKELKEYNLELIEYKDCHDLTVKCINNHVYKVVLHDIRRGRKCPECAPENRKNTCIEKYGVSNPSQCPEIYEKILKTSYSKKEYKMPSGKIVEIMGYEPYCLDVLLKDYKEEQIVVDPKIIPRINYLKKLENGETREAVYFQML